MQETIIISEVSNQIQGNYIAWSSPLAQATFTSITPEVIQWCKLIASNIWHQWDDNYATYNSIIIHNGTDIL